MGTSRVSLISLTLAYVAVGCGPKPPANTAVASTDDRVVTQEVATQDEVLASDPRALESSPIPTMPRVPHSRLGMHATPTNRATCARCGDGVINQCGPAHGCDEGARNPQLISRVRPRPCVRTPATTEYCDGADIPITCADLGYASGSLQCRSDCSGWNETPCAPCQPSDAVAACRTSTQTLSAYLGLAASENEMLVAWDHTSHDGHYLAGARYDRELRSEGEFVIAEGYGHPSVTRVTDGWLVFAKADHTRMFFVPDSGPIARSREITGVWAIATRTLPSDPILVIRDGELTSLSRNGRVIRSTPLPGLDNSGDLRVITNGGGGLIVTKTNRGRGTRVIPFDRELSLGEPVDHELIYTALYMAGGSTARYHAVFERIQGARHPDPIPVVTMTIDEHGHQVGSFVRLGSAYDVMPHELVTVGGESVAMLYTREQSRTVAMLMAPAGSPPIHYATVSTLTQMKAAVMGDQIVAVWAVPYTKQLRLARLQP